MESTTPISPRRVLAPAREAEFEQRRGEFERLIHEHEHQLNQFAFRLLGSRELAEDTLQEACIRAYRAYSKFVQRDDASTRAWLFQVVYRSCIDVLRRRNGRELPIDLQGLEDVSASNETARVLDRRGLVDALTALPLDLRAAVLLVDLLGFDYETAARQLQVPTGTLASRINRARAALRPHLRELVD